MNFAIMLDNYYVIYGTPESIQKVSYHSDKDLLDKLWELGTQ